MNILLVEDEPHGREVIADCLENYLGHHVTQCSNGIEALALFRTNNYPIVVTDIKMPEMDGIELLKNIKKLDTGKMSDVILITAHGDMSTAIEALRAGAYDYLNKPIELNELTAIIKRSAEHQALIIENYDLTHFFNEKVAEATRETESKLEQLKSSFADIADIGEVGIFSEVMSDAIALAAKLREDMTMPVLIEGETGTGKEIIARIIHYDGNIRSGPFIPINCSTISPALLESELFGYEGGAFTGAKKTGQIGKFELANDGTIFLDEIGDLPLELQPKLLRVLQERDFYRVGGVKKIKLSAQIICASNQRISKLVEDGKFREDLYYRLNVGKVYLPPLRERKNEIEPLALLFMKKFTKRRKRKFKAISPEAVEILKNYPWFGNIRELRNILERIVMLYDDVEIRPEHLGFLINEDKGRDFSVLSASNISQSFLIHFPEDHLDLEEIESMIIRKVIKMFGGNKTHTAEYLGISRPTLRKKIK